MSLTKSLGHSAFLELFGENPLNNILDFLVVFDQFDYSMADLASQADVGYSTLKELLPELVQKKIIIQTRISGKSAMYKLNKKNPMVKKFALFYWDLVSQSPSSELPQKKIAVPA